MALAITVIICFTILLIVLAICFFCADEGDVGRDIVDRICESKEKREKIKAEAYITAQEKRNK